MSGFVELLRDNRNYRYTWLGQIVSEVGDHFNNIAVFSLAVKHPNSGLVVAGVLLARAIPAICIAPLAGVLLDRLDRRKVMIASDLVRAVVAAAFVLTIASGSSTLLYVLSALLMVASPFFTSGRASILPTIATPGQLHAANSLTQTTQWTTLTVGAMLGGASVAGFGYYWAFLINALSFLVSAACIARLQPTPGTSFRATRSRPATEGMRPWTEYIEGLRYMKATPLFVGIAVVSMGWATGGGAAQILFSLFGENVFHRGAQGIGTLWGCAGIGLLIGSGIAHYFGRKLTFNAYKWTIAICYLLHGSTYAIFSQMTQFPLALFFIGLSRLAVGITSVLNFSQLLRHIRDEYRGRVFATIETLTWGVMLFSMTIAGVASLRFSPPTIGLWAGVFSSLTAVYWLSLHVTGRLPEPDDGPDTPTRRVHEHVA